MSADQFVDAVTEGQGVAPLYFAFAADANKRERELLDDQEPPTQLTLDDALELARAGAVLLLISETLHPPLTTVVLPYQAMGKRAAEMLLARLRSGNAANFTPSPAISGPVVWRQSVTVQRQRAPAG
jgi:hypothetical protein